MRLVDLDSNDKSQIQQVAQLRVLVFREHWPEAWPNIFEHVAKIKNLRNHSYAFYQKLGFVIVGVMPAANGPGKPDIFMAKRVF